MFADFFIKRPIFATVCSLVLVIAGSTCIPGLPVAQYPQIAPPRVNVTCNYTGANAEVVESAVTTVLEKQINGAQNIRYINSTSGNDGTSSVDITFNLERDVDLASVDVQTRVAAVEGRLPEDVKRTGVSVNKVSSQFVLAIGIGCRDNRYDSQFISNYCDVYVKDALKRVKGVGDAQIFGERKYSMRVWLDPQKLANRSMTAVDVVNAVAEQNVQVAAGQIGQPPAPDGQLYQMSVRAVGRLKTPQEFENMIIRATPDGQMIRLRDVGRAELGAENYQSIVRYRGREAVGIGIFQTPTANALEVSKGVREEMERLAKRFPPGLEYDYAFDTTLAVRESIKEVLITLAQAIGLVVLVTFVFLQDWRSTFIPSITIPVSLVGTFAFMNVLGFSINTLTLFGITLATGLVVDDAIVVIENISRLIKERSLGGVEAAHESMKEITGAVIAISLVLGAVFIPVAFFPGTTGLLYRQFALTIACSVGISTFVALTLTPALSAKWLKPHSEKKSIIFAPINMFLDWLKESYEWSLRLALKVKPLVILAFFVCMGLTYWLFTTVPKGFVPNEDQGYFIIIVESPEGVSLGYTAKVLQKVDEALKNETAIQSNFGIAGFSFAGNSPNNGILFASLKPWKERKEGQSLDQIIERIRGPLSKITDANVIPFNPPVIEGLGNFGGFQFELQDMLGGDTKMIADATKLMCQKGNQCPELRGVFSSFKANSPQLVVTVFRDKAKTVGVDMSDIFRTLQVFLGSEYVNDFDMGSRIYRVYVQADQKFRSNPKDIEQFYVRSKSGKMISLANLVTVTHTTTPQTITHFNLFRSTEINGSAAPGISSGQAMEKMEQLAKENLPPGMGYEWSGIALEQKESSSKSVILFALGFVFVFLVLAAQYESFLDPFIILFSVPLAMLGALAAQSARGLENDVFCQIGLVMLIGLASKNAILIVEYANQLYDKGLSIKESVVKAATIRLRPILMTSLAFIMGIMPLVFAHGAGAASRHSLGTAVAGGMIVSSILSLYLVPVVYEYVGMLRQKLRSRKNSQVIDEEAPLAGSHRQ